MKETGGGRRYQKYTEPIIEAGKNYGSGKAKKDLCDSIEFSKKLQKVTPEIASVSLGDILEIKPNNNSLGAYNKDGAICGNVVSPFNDSILECIARGYKFGATVINVLDNNCTVRVKIKE